MVLIRLLLTSLVAAVGLVLASYSPAQACSCAMRAPAAHLGSSDVVFTGTLLDRIPPPEAPVMSSMDPARHVFAVDRVYVGDVGATTEVLSAVSGASCGLENMEVGEEYLVMAELEPDGQAWAGLCGGTAPAGHRNVAQVEQRAGPGRVPVPVEAPAPGVPGPTVAGAAGGDADGPSPLWWGLGLLALALGAGLVVRR